MRQPRRLLYLPKMDTRPIRFVHRGQVREITAAVPTRTVLDWLREDARCTGTKEGCGEGDCGACIVIVAELAEPNESTERADLAVQAHQAHQAYRADRDDRDDRAQAPASTS